MRKLDFLLVLLVLASLCSANIIYVDDDATGANDGSSWENAFIYLQDALAAAANGDEIRVSQGIYKPDQGVGITPGDRTATFQLKNGVLIRGGYAGLGESDPNARNIDKYETILSGDLDGNDGPNFSNNGENSYRVVTGTSRGEIAVFDGFIITAGNANGSGGYCHGGGMYNFGSPTLINCTFIGNSAYEGAGMFNNGGMYNMLHIFPRLTNCIFSRNRAQNAGGGIFSTHTATGLLNCTFAGNLALYGCALACNSLYATSRLQVTNCILWDDGGEIANFDESTIATTYSDVQGGWPGEGNIDTDPCFANAGNGDYHLKSQAGRLFQQSQSWVLDDVTSPCIDAGDMSSPIGFEPFPNGGRINMGAYGGTAEASKTYFGEPVCETIVAGDINGDCKVNFLDFGLMALHWLAAKNPCSQVPEFYYYYYEEKIYLDVSAYLITICFEEGVSDAQKQAVIRDDPTLGSIYDEIPSHGLVLVQTKVGTCESDIIQAVERLNKLSQVRYCTPVFEYSNLKLVLMDKFVVRFKPDVTEEEIETLNEEYGVAVVRKSPSRPNRYVLRVINPKEKSALELANIYNQLPQTEYGTPNFIVMGGVLTAW